MTKLGGARLYLVSPALLGERALADLVPELAAAGVDIVQLREKQMTVEELGHVAEPVLAACQAAGIPFIVNDHPDLAARLGADGVHVGQEDAPVGEARSVIGDGIVGLSTHNHAQIDAARDSAPDYIAVGPVFETPTKAGRAAVGVELISWAAAHAPEPWFAIGGIDASNLDEVLEAGARRIVIVRAITEATDPASAAAVLKARLLAR